MGKYAHLYTFITKSPLIEDFLHESGDEHLQTTLNFAIKSQNFKDSYFAFSGFAMGCPAKRMPITFECLSLIG